MSDSEENAGQRDHQEHDAIYRADTELEADSVSNEDSRGLSVLAITRLSIEFLGKHPFATGLFALISLIGFMLAIVSYGVDRQEARATADQIEAVQSRLNELEPLLGHTTHPSGKQIPSFEGSMKSQHDALIEFAFDNDGSVIYFDAWIEYDSFDVYRSEDIEENDLTFWYNCQRQPPGALNCNGATFLIDPNNSSTSMWFYSSGAWYLKGYWAIQVIPGMKQGIGFIKLSGVETQDIY